MISNSSNTLEFLAYTLWIGCGATVVLDIWALLLNRFFNVRSLNYALVGRWLGHIPYGQWLQDDINKAKPVHGETIIGWGIHYLIGIVFAACLLLVTGGTKWACQPTLLPALLFGVATIFFPYFILQPCLGAGIASRKLPNANLARFKSLIAHTVFGGGLFLSALAVSWLC